MTCTGFMRAVAATGYDGPLSLEVFNDQFRGGSPRTIAVDGHRSLVFLMDQVARREPGIRLTAPTMPDRIRWRRRRFRRIRRRARQRPGDRWAAVAASAFAGWGGTSPRRSSSGSRARSASSSIPMPEGSPHAAHIAHGLNICDVGLAVDDADATVARAKALGATTFQQPVGPGELRDPGDPWRGRRGPALHRPQERSGRGLGDRIPAGRGGRLFATRGTDPRSITSPRR